MRTDVEFCKSIHQIVFDFFVKRSPALSNYLVHLPIFFIYFYQFFS
jgi:hypothetical protein